MDSSNSNTPCFLDKVRLDSGTEEYKKYFRNLTRYNKKKSIQLINDEGLSFYSLFALRSEIQKYNLLPHLNSKNKNALWIADSILSRESAINTRTVPDYRKMSYKELRWIFEAGRTEDEPGDDLDEVLDSAAILLVREHKDKTILNDIWNIILKRYKKGLFIKDMVWALFESRDPKCLVMAANRLQSNDPDEVRLARKLLSFIPYIQTGRESDTVNQYAYILDWVQENYPFLYYTGESFQQSNAPVPYDVSLEGKYLFKPVSPETGKILNPLNDYEQRLINSFKSRDKKNRLLLANYSFLLHKQNVHWWSTWLNYPVTEQERIAETMIGGLP